MSDHETYENGSDSGASSASLLNDFKDSVDINDQSVNLEDFTTASFVSSDKDDQEEPTEDVPSEWEDLLGSGSVLKKVLKEGTPDTRPNRLQTCILRYESRLEDGTVLEKFDDFKVQVGDCEVVLGVDVAVGLMNVGDIWLLKIEPRLAYGSKGLDKKVPPDTTIYFELELKSIEPDIEIEELSIAQRKEIGNRKRERGNWWYGRGENTLAIQCYRRALDYLDEVEGIKTPEPDGKSEITDAALQELLEDRVSVCNNMAAAQIKQGLHDAALNSLQTVLRCQPNNIKALYRKAKVFRAKNDIPTALSCLQKANDLSPNNADIQKEINSIQSLLQKQKVSEREFAKRMFNNPSEKSSKEKKAKQSKVLIWATLGLSIAVGLAGVAAYKFKLS